MQFGSWSTAASVQGQVPVSLSGASNRPVNGSLSDTHGGGPPADLFALMQTVTVDAVTAEVAAALAARNVPAILLKGPSLSAWLYAEGATRTYRDVDLLIGRQDRQAAENVLRELGFADVLAPMAHPRMESEKSYPWRRDWVEVDLHTSIWGFEVDEDTVWAVLSEERTPITVAGARVDALSLPARALHVALHAAHHGDSSPKSAEDLRRATAADASVWDDAARLAERLGASGTFATGLRLDPAGGVPIARRLGLEDAVSLSALLDASQVELAWGFEELASTPGLAPKIRLVAREIFPSPSFMRWWSPLARRGRRGLVAAYLLRPFTLARKAVPGFRAWQAARRRARGGGPGAKH
jgi:hypothetical protein